MIIVNYIQAMRTEMKLSDNYRRLNIFYYLIYPNLYQCRSHEILKLRIKEIFFKTSGNYQYVEVLVNGKTVTRHIPQVQNLVHSNR
jgi:hypothetical protein